MKAPKPSYRALTREEFNSYGYPNLRGRNVYDKSTRDSPQRRPLTDQESNPARTPSKLNIEKLLKYESDDPQNARNRSYEQMSNRLPPIEVTNLQGPNLLRQQAEIQDLLDQVRSDYSKLQHTTAMQNSQKLIQDVKMETGTEFLRSRSNFMQHLHNPFVTNANFST